MKTEIIDWLRYGVLAETGGKQKYELTDLVENADGGIVITIYPVKEEKVVERE